MGIFRSHEVEICFGILPGFSPTQLRSTTTSGSIRYSSLCCINISGLALANFLRFEFRSKLENIQKIIKYDSNPKTEALLEKHRNILRIFELLK